MAPNVKDIFYTLELKKAAILNRIQARLRESSGKIAKTLLGLRDLFLFTFW